MKGDRILHYEIVPTDTRKTFRRGAATAQGLAAEAAPTLRGDDPGRVPAGPGPMR